MQTAEVFRLQAKQLVFLLFNKLWRGSKNKINRTARKFSISEANRELCREM